MTHFIAHRINDLAVLQQLPTELGAEIDLRDRADRLILQHDPFIDGQDAEPFFAAYRHGTLILNIKSERIELRILELLKQYKIENYFFLDSSFPMIQHLIKLGEHRVAVRFSEFEGLDTVLALEGKIEWVWVDCFTRLPLTRENYATLKGAGFKLCLVSPELQGRATDIEPYKKELESLGVEFDAICTKQANVNLWRQ
ncbi:MAG: hypothetical protein K2W95_34980 [Candidatus Obscuribacterales bacterium]|nr:hypothetical protein [Candidatus Obscuribacterales bacterium]